MTQKKEQLECYKVSKRKKKSEEIESERVEEKLRAYSCLAHTKQAIT